MRVLLCRPHADAEATAARLRAAGHDPVLAPVLAIETRPVPWPDGPIDALLVTSRHALPGPAAAGAGLMRRKPLFAVGQATAHAARARGFEDVRVGPGDAAGLADLVTLTLPCGGRLLYLAGEVRKDTLADRLAARGFGLVIREAYAARVCGPWPADVGEALRHHALEACLHFSARSAALALAASTTAGARADFRALHHVCLAAAVAAPLQAGGCATIVAARPDEDSLMQALASIVH